VSPDTNTIHVTALDRRNSSENIDWQMWHYHCHLASSSCTSSANWSAASVSPVFSSNFDQDFFIGHYHGITSSATREAHTSWTDTRIFQFNQDYNVFSDRLT
jgi:hypothetical protein